MSEFFLAPALVQLRSEVDAAFPQRDHSSDGWIGDASHAARASDHNPCWTCSGRMHGIVRATDTDIGPDGSPQLDLRTVLLKAAIGDPRVWYVISNRVIYSRTHGFQPRRYTGSNPHDHHVHISLQGANGISADLAQRLAFDTTPWLEGGHTPTTLPAVYLGRLLRAAAHPAAAVHPVNVRRTQRALVIRTGTSLNVDGIYGRATRAAYATWQRSLGYTGADADGIPGMRSLTALGANRFRVLASN